MVSLLEMMKGECSDNDCRSHRASLSSSQYMADGYEASKEISRYACDQVD